MPALLTTTRRPAGRPALLACLVLPVLLTLGACAARPTAHRVAALLDDDRLLQADSGGLALPRCTGPTEHLPASASGRMEAVPLAVRSLLSPPSSVLMLVPRDGATTTADGARIFYLVWRPGGFHGTPTTYGPLTLRDLQRLAPQTAGR